MTKVETLWEMGDRKAASEAALAYIKQAVALPRFERPESGTVRIGGVVVDSGDFDFSRFPTIAGPSGRAGAVDQGGDETVRGDLPDGVVERVGNEEVT